MDLILGSEQDNNSQVMAKAVTKPSILKNVI